MDLRVFPLDSDRVPDFYKIHSEENNNDWCYCVAWWTSNWEVWGRRSSRENKERRELLFKRAVYDGYILYADNEPVGWCQCGRRDQFPNLRNQYNFILDPDIWAITCFLLLPAYREIGLAHYFISEILNDLRQKGIGCVQGFPRRGYRLSADNVWTGPEGVFKKAGFKLELDDPLYPIYTLRLD